MMLSLFKQPCHRVPSSILVVVFVVMVLIVSSCLVDCKIAEPASKENVSQTTGRLYNLTSGVFKAVETRIYNQTVHKLIGVPYARRPNAFERSEPFLSKPRATGIQNADTWPVSLDLSICS